MALLLIQVPMAVVMWRASLLCVPLVAVIHESMLLLLLLNPLLLFLIGMIVLIRGMLLLLLLSVLDSVPSEALVHHRLSAASARNAVSPRGGNPSVHIQDGR
jgi:hypothetical protein